MRPYRIVVYQKQIEAHIIPALGALRLHALSPQQVQAMLSGLQLKRLSPATIRGVRAVLRAALSDAMRWGLVGRNAAALAHGPRVPRPELKVFSTEQAQTFLEAIQGERLEAFFCTAIATGLRLGELLGLRWSDVDLDAGVLAVSSGFAAGWQTSAVRRAKEQAEPPPRDCTDICCSGSEGPP
jgi:integrase